MKTKIHVVCFSELWSFTSFVNFHWIFCLVAVRGCCDLCHSKTSKECIVWRTVSWWFFLIQWSSYRVHKKLEDKYWDCFLLQIKMWFLMNISNVNLTFYIRFQNNVWALYLYRNGQKQICIYDFSEKRFFQCDRVGRSSLFKLGLVLVFYFYLLFWVFFLMRSFGISQT